MKNQGGKGKNTFYLFLLLFYLFIFKDLLVRFTSVFGYTDELIALLAVPIFILELVNSGMKVRINKNGYGIFVVLFVVTGLVGSVTNSFQPLYGVALPSMFLSIKFWLAIYTGGMLLKNLNIELYAHKIYTHIKIVIVIYTVLFVIDNLFGIFNSTIRYGIRATQLFYGVPTSFAAICVFLFGILLVVRPYVKGSMKYLVWILVLMCSTLRSKAFAAAFAFVLIYYFAYIRKKKIRVRTLIIFVPFVLLIVWDQIQYYFFSSIQADSARYQLLVTAVRIAKDFFPFGTGFGTFASFYSAVSYSPVYSMYGISNVHGLREGATYFVSDSFWPMILGETGWIGLLLTIIIVVRLLKRVQRLKTINIALYTSSLCIIGYLLIISMAESAFANPIAMPLAVWIGYALNRERGVKSLR